MKTFEVFQVMNDEDMDIQAASLSNIIKIDIYGMRGEVTIGVSRQVAQDLMDGRRFAGGFILACKDQYDAIVARTKK